MPNAPALDEDRIPAAEILEARRERLLALPAESLRRPRISPQRAMELTAILSKHLAPLLGRLEAELSEARAAERRAQAEGLEDAAMAFYMAALRARRPETSESEAERKRLAARVRDRDASLLRWAQAFFAGQPAREALLAHIRPGSGHRDDAEDVLRLVALFREAGPWPPGIAELTPEALAEAARDATRLLGLAVASRESAPKALDLARRAYTAWLSDYEALRKLAVYLSPDDADTRKRFPGVTGRRGSGSRRTRKPSRQPATEAAE